MFRGSDIPRVIIVGGFLLLGACTTDAPTTAPATRTAPSAAKADVIVESTSTTGDSVTVQLRVTPTGGWYAIGKSRVYFPPNSICEPSTTSYGPTEWDKPCTPAKGDVHIVARTKNDHTRTWIHFSPDLRFVPSAASSGWVYLYMYSDEVKRATVEQRAAVQERNRIFWLPSAGALPVDESLTDATLATSFHWPAGWVYRRVKHFSGYQVGADLSAPIKTTEETLLSSDAGVGISY